MAIGATTKPEPARLIEAALALGSTIVGMRNEIEHERRLPPLLVEKLRDLGFFWLWLPRAFGGPELGLTDFIRVIEALARFDGSVAWCVTNGGAYARFAGFLPEPVAHHIFVEKRAVVAGNMGPLGRAVPVPGGYRVTGHWAYGSGITHSEWVLGGCIVLDERGVPRRGPDGAPDARTAFFPTAAAEVIDTWEVGGLRGTGSHDYRIADLFVPESHVVSRGGEDPLLPGPLYALPRNTAFGVAIAAVPLGIARAALDALRDLSAAKTPRIGSAVLRDRPVVQAAVGRAEQLRAARAFLFEACDEAWGAVSAGALLTLEQRALVRLACAQAAEVAKGVVQAAYDAGGGTSIYESCPLQRCFRDAHAAAQHVQVQSGNFETGGRVLLGLDPGTPIL